MNQWMISMLAVIALSGCAPLIHENKSIAIDVYPIKYQIAMQIGTKGEQDAERRWQKLVKEYPQVLLNNPVNFYYSDSIGKRAVQRWRNELVSNGAEKTKLTLAQNKSLGAFNVHVEFVANKSVSPICQPQAIEGRLTSSFGCVVNSNLWQSMVSPQDALDHSISSRTPPIPSKL